MNNLRGILLIIGAMAAFTIEDTLIKMLSGSFATGQILLIVGLGSSTFFALLATLRGQSVFARDAWTPGLIMRASCEGLTAATFVTALSLVDISVVAAVFQTTPLAITMGAALFFGETVGWRRWSAVGIGFFGVLLIIRPGLAGFEPAVLLVLISVALVALRDLYTRRISAKVSSLIVSFQGFLAVVVAGAVLTALQGETLQTVDRTHFSAIASMLAASVAGYYMLVEAMRVSEASAVQPFRYSRLVLSMLAGIVVFGERPDALTLTGAALIIATGLYTFLRERALARTARRARA